MEPAEGSEATAETGDREALTAKLVEMDALIASLKRLPADPMVLRLVEAKVAARQQVQELLRASRPLELRLRRGLEELDRQRKRCKRLQEEEEEADLRTLLTAKQQEKEEAHDSMATKEAEVDALMAAKQAEAVAEDDALVTTSASKDVLMTAAQCPEHPVLIFNSKIKF